MTVNADLSPMYRFFLSFLCFLFVTSGAHAYKVYVRSDQEDVRDCRVFVELLDDEAKPLVSDTITLPLNGIEIKKTVVPTNCYLPTGTFRITLLKGGQPLDTSSLKMTKVKNAPYGDLYIYVRKDNSLMTIQDQCPWK